MTDEDYVDLLLEAFKWENDIVMRYHAYRVLLQMRGECNLPTFDDYRVGRTREK